VPDLLVRLYRLPTPPPAPINVLVRRAFSAEKHLVSCWIAEQFTAAWAGESEAAFARLPVSCFVAVEQEQLLGFACYDATARGFFGPFGVAQSARGRGLGRALLQATLADMSANGYGYAIIGHATEIAFYREAIDAIEIPDSDPGFYRGLLKQ
jgi:GNAT superfamily N-acetyltransferase